MNAEDVLASFRAAGVVEALDCRVASALGRIGGEGDAGVLLGAALACRAPRHGHVCVELAGAERQVRMEGLSREAAGALWWPDAGRWIESLRASALCREVARWDAEQGSDTATPLVLERGRLYLDRYWGHEARLARELIRRLDAPAAAVDEDRLANGLARLFDGPDGGQREAAEAAARRSLTVITGGPGTGKTFTMARIMVLLVEQFLAAGSPPPRFALLAPTGKAAARMGQTIQESAGRMRAADADTLAAAHAMASTIHRALGIVPDRPTRARHGPDNPLAADVVVVDEASMVDFALMARLVEAVAGDARLVLAGDPDQLASVEAGAVLGDIRAAAGRAVVGLTRNWRFATGGGIGELARAFGAGDEDGAMAFLCSRRGDDVEFILPGQEGELPARALHAMVEGYRPCIEAASRGDAETALEALDGFRVLCAHREGPRGVAGINRAIRDLLAVHAGEVGPVIISRNDYDLGLFNGDTGVVVREPGGMEMACFPGGAPGEVRRFPPGLLPPHDPAFATTVHRAQGSQFGAVVLVLPDRPSPVLTRELLYTGLTRARARAMVLGAETVIRHALRERVRRFSGLREKLSVPSSL